MYIYSWCYENNLYRNTSDDLDSSDNLAAPFDFYLLGLPVLVFRFWSSDPASIKAGQTLDTCG